jgi:hypothetical protein
VKRKRFRDLSPAGKVWAVIAMVVSLGLVVSAERDIQTRSASELRGSKRLWQLVSLNAIGALGYFTLGRRET